MSKIKRILLKFKPIVYFVKGRSFLNNTLYNEVRALDVLEMSKRPLRNEVINHILSGFHRKTMYLEIGVRNPKDNFELINADVKYSVDPGIEYEDNPVDFKITSDLFFNELSQDRILNSKIKFDVIFIDGLHLANQVNRDIINAMTFIKDDGFIVLHDCNPPTEWHTRYNYGYHHTPALFNWNGTTWKAFLKWRCNPNIKSCCIDSDFGIGILSKTQNIGESLAKEIEFYEFDEFDKNRKEYLNLVEFGAFKQSFN